MQCDAADFEDKACEESRRKLNDHLYLLQKPPSSQHRVLGGIPVKCLLTENISIWSRVAVCEVEFDRCLAYCCHGAHHRNPLDGGDLPLRVGEDDVHHQEQLGGSLKRSLPEEEQGAQPLHVGAGGEDAGHLLPEDEDWERQQNYQKNQ